MVSAENFQEIYGRSGQKAIKAIMSAVMKKTPCLRLKKHVKVEVGNFTCRRGSHLKERFLLSRPFLPIDDVPLFYELLHSQSMEHVRQHRQSPASAGD